MSVCEGGRRHHSTDLLHTPLRTSGRKKRNTNSKGRVSDLLAVDISSISEEKARITALKARDITHLLDNPDVSLQELYRLKLKPFTSSKKPPSLSSSSLLSPHATNNRRMGVTIAIPSELEQRRLKGWSFTSFTTPPLTADPLTTIKCLPDPIISTIKCLPDPKADVETPSQSSAAQEIVNHGLLTPADIPRVEECRIPASLHATEAFECGGIECMAERAQEDEGSAEELETEIPVVKIMKGNGKKVGSVSSKPWLHKHLLKRDKRRQDASLAALELYYEVCISSGMIKQAVFDLGIYCKKNLKQGKACPVSLFEVLFKGFATSGSIDLIQSLLDMMDEFKVKLSLSCYAACFECLGRLDVPEKNMNMLSALLEDMKIQNYCVQDLFTRCAYFGNQRSMVLKAIKAKIPDFSIDMNLPKLGYNVDLLSALNDTSRSKAPEYISPSKGLFSEEDVCSWVDEQVHNELVGVIKIPNMAYNCSAHVREKDLQKQSRIEKVWEKSVKVGLQRDLKMLHIQHVRKANRVGAIFKSISTPELVSLILQEVRIRFGDSHMFTAPVSFLCSQLGLKVKRLHDLKFLVTSGSIDITSKVYKDYCKWYLNPQNHPQGPVNSREIWQQLLVHEDNKQEIDWKPWPYELTSEVGRFLYNIILRDVKISVSVGKGSKERHEVPVFYTVYRRLKHAHQEQLKMHPAVYRIYHPRGQPYILLDSCNVPMTCPPKPWIDFKTGSFPLMSPALLRVPENTSKGLKDEIFKEYSAIPTQQIYAALDALNQLGSIPWKVNGPVLDVVTSVFNSGGSMSLDIPHPPTVIVPEPVMPAGASKAERFRINEERVLLRKQRAEMYSLWCDALYRLSLAHHFRDRLFWLPHNMDFRGRVYPIAPHLQHMGCDMARSLLVFGKGEKLGPTGLDWLKIHTINLTGSMKRDSIAARLKYANEILPTIIDSADYPLTGKKWWTKSDEPWQTLGACMEIAAAFRSGDPESFVSNFPVHQDGSCNGLQHYAALGRDSAGAASVNLCALEKPADVYSEVSEIVERKRKTDAASGNLLAQELNGFITRKVVKQTIMTTVYGVTRYGARLQIAGQLKDLGFPATKINDAAIYLANLTFGSIGEMFTSTRKIQDWFTECATLVTKVLHQPMRWITPLGLLVIQPYYKPLKIRSYTDDGSDKTSVVQIPNVVKQRNGFPPNFIHSLDSCHMMMTALFCERAGVTYVSVHDCFWVHPSNIDQLNKICREQFVALHSEPILEKLSQYLVDTFIPLEQTSDLALLGVEYRYLQRVLLRVPCKGNFNLEEVLSSKYFFS